MWYISLDHEAIYSKIKNGITNSSAGSYSLIDRLSYHVPHCGCHSCIIPTFVLRNTWGYSICSLSVKWHATLHEGLNPHCPQELLCKLALTYSKRVLSLGNHTKSGWQLFPATSLWILTSLCQLTASVWTNVVCILSYGSLGCIGEDRITFRWCQMTYSSGRRS